MASYKWNPVEESDGDDGSHTLWATEINNSKYGKYAWIENSGEHEYSITTSNYEAAPIMVCKGLAAAKRWVSINIPQEKAINLTSKKGKGR